MVVLRKQDLEKLFKEQIESVRLSFPFVVYGVLLVLYQCGNQPS